ncbi:hypothetical protein [Oribacterium sp. C9]|uniref:hypothetical protein n=1 Tax=Oribacterium sp. C9 TaxID=1943579 RepID=UPI001115681A|nr:hypothetical protein [Oribacterium sp. C9]
MDSIVKNRELNMVIPNRTVLMNAEKFKEDGLELNTVFVPPVNHSMIPRDFRFNEYLKEATRGEISQEKHEKFLIVVHEPYDRASNVNNGFWWGNDTSERPENLIETYSKRFTECFGEKGRNLVTAPSAIREILENIYVNGKKYAEYYGISRVNKMNFLEVVCEVIENMSRGEIARSFSPKSKEHIIVTYHPMGKNYVNVYFPVNAFADIGMRKIPPDRY